MDMVVLDMQMPGVDGMVVASEIRRDRRLRDLPVLAVTALTQPGDAVRILDAGCDAYLAKPLSVSEVRKMVTEMLADSHGPHYEAWRPPQGQCVCVAARRLRWAERADRSDRDTSTHARSG